MLDKTKETPPVNNQEVSQLPAEKKLSSVLADIEPGQAPEFRFYLRYLIEHVSVEEFLGDRLAQANTDVVIGGFGTDKNFGDPFPAIVIKTPKYKDVGPGTKWIHESFMLQGDNSHFYYFDFGWPIAENGGLPYLRNEDIVPFEEYNWDKFPKHQGMAPGMDFTKPLERAPIAGGEVELFNYKSGQWEVSNEGVSEPINENDLKQAISEITPPLAVH